MTSQTLLLILGDQLNRNSLIFEDVDTKTSHFMMAEVLDESSRYLSSKQRTTVFLSAMRHFAENCQKDDLPLFYYSLDKRLASFSDALDHHLKNTPFKTIRCVLAGDYRVVKEINHWTNQHDISIEWLPDQHFIARQGEFKRWLSERKQPRMEYWYRQLRKERAILMSGQSPVGGRWNFDQDNRHAFSQKGPDALAETHQFKPDKITKDVIKAIHQYLPDLPGDLDEFNWPVTLNQAKQTLDDFISQRLAKFGDYQDAMWLDQPFLYHSRLSVALNLKLLSPDEVIDAAIQAYERNEAPLNAVEGFVRQILGWREYVRGLYWTHKQDWLQMNALNARRELPQLYWDAKTDMTCLNQAVMQVLTYGYGHHIQRLMVTGLFSLLWGVKPKAIHEWYLAMYVDAVAWVEVPNTLGMSQYADGGIVGSKPYIASGAYINRMSNYCQHCRFDPKQAHGEKACPFTTLYWAFVDRHHDLLSQNPRLGMQVKNWQRKSKSEQKAIRKHAEKLHRQLP
ncbi:alpha-deoxyribodipyrimidine photolyase-like protein [Methylophaga frappieri]|uniref:Alpha-deoxyribodipyrimidine photolyase-like protein n=1 Tax=Methylophaga frappieri (strain ATCC BAA-2434 / DSM 25690 / JAM7) TaxID=754477 RepID=I1YIR5_METFJ|nr:cryptochrome/photolyase family protein [Methylophaga frappieri]AFJ02808.1 alpha-deoxyribodipyrimidine photolyase-like protein [Methylophaga frappieri]